MNGKNAAERIFSERSAKGLPEYSRNRHSFPPEAPASETSCRTEEPRRLLHSGPHHTEGMEYCLAVRRGATNGFGNEKTAASGNETG